jgi:hypothetical protein
LPTQHSNFEVSILEANKAHFSTATHALVQRVNAENSEIVNRELLEISIFTKKNKIKEYEMCT